MNDRTLEVRNLNVTIRTDQREVRPVNDVSLDVPAGSIVGIVGESGCGKSMTARAVMGLLPSSAIMSVCAEMVDKTGDRYLDNKEKMAVSCYYRHIAEMFVPTFTPVILMLSLTSVNPGMFMLSMIPPAVAAKHSSPKTGMDSPGRFPVWKR